MFFNHLCSYTILHTYDLVCIVDVYIERRKFPSQSSWEKLYLNKINNYYVYEWESNTEVDSVLYRQIQLCFYSTVIWNFALKYPSMLTYCSSVAQIVLNLIYFKTECLKCKSSNMQLNLTFHVILDFRS